MKFEVYTLKINNEKGRRETERKSPASNSKTAILLSLLTTVCFCEKLDPLTTQSDASNRVSIICLKHDTRYANTRKHFVSIIRKNYGDSIRIVWRQYGDYLV